MSCNCMTLQHTAVYKYRMLRGVRGGAACSSPFRFLFLDVCGESCEDASSKVALESDAFDWSSSKEPSNNELHSCASHFNVL